MQQKQAALEAKGKAKASSSGKGGGNGGDGGDSGDDDDAIVNLDFTEVWSTACKMRTQLKTIISDATALDNKVNDNNAWAWARNKQNVELLRKKCRRCEGFSVHSIENS